MSEKLSVWMPATPGGRLTRVGEYETLAQARAAAQSEAGHRRDLRYQDVEIRLGQSGKRIEFAGPSR